MAERHCQRDDVGGIWGQPFTLVMGWYWRHLKLTFLPCGGTKLVALQIVSGTAFETNTYSCGRMALAAFEVLTPTLVAGRHWRNFR